MDHVVSPFVEQDSLQWEFHSTTCVEAHRRLDKKRRLRECACTPYALKLNEKHTEKLTTLWSENKSSAEEVVTEEEIPNGWDPIKNCFVRIKWYPVTHEVWYQYPATHLLPIPRKILVSN